MINRSPVFLFVKSKKNKAKMKTQKFFSARVLRASDAMLILPFQMLPVSEGETLPQDIDVEDIARLCVRVNGIGETGSGRPISTTGATRYEIDGSELHVYLESNDSLGDMSVTVDGTYGQVRLHAVINVTVSTDGQTEVELEPYIFAAIAAGGSGAEYKTDIYMDREGRVVVERLEDGSTMLLDEHENPILKRNADGSTQYFDAYQSARLMISASGEVEAAYTEDGTVKTLAVAEAILARTQKRLLYNTAGEETIKDAEGNILTHADIYAMLMTSPDFVVLVRSDHAFYTNLVTPTKIAFTCSYLGTDGEISAERVNITNANVVSYTSGKGITQASNGAVNISNGGSATGQYSFSQGFRCVASAINSHAEGRECTASRDSAHAEGRVCIASSLAAHAEGRSTLASGEHSHAEGDNSKAKGTTSHAEGNYCTTNAGTSHAEGNYCTTGANGGSAHAEGSYTNANAAASHTEGYRTITTEGGSHAQGCWNKVEGGAYAFMHGCGTADADRKNALLIAGDEVYMLGVGGYDGTNYGQEGVQSVQSVIRALQLKLVNL